MSLTLPVFRGPSAGYPLGRSDIIKEAESKGRRSSSKMSFCVVKLGPAKAYQIKSEMESAWVLLKGIAAVEFGGRKATVRRKNPFDEGPTVVHLGPGEPIKLRAMGAGAEFAVASTPNKKSFEPRLFLPSEVLPEYRGAGLVQGACLRNVRLVFDQKARPDSNLVLGEVINYPGRWSSYPPHHHPQPEIYHYRFSDPRGYGHAEIGDNVIKVKSFDTVSIPPGLDHAQVSAPGYAMYYLWAIRHLKGNPYSGFTFSKEHKWTLNPKMQGWIPPGPR
jgi:5-deoxy-glucuronate isomerase